MPQLLSHAADGEGELSQPDAACERQDLITDLSLSEVDAQGSPST